MLENNEGRKRFTWKEERIVEKADLIRKRAKMELEASQARQAALDLEEKMERLRRAKGRLYNVTADARQQERKT